MPAHIVISFSIIDSDTLKLYSPNVPETLAPYNGEFLFKGPIKDQLQGEHDFDAQAVIAFPSSKEAKAWYTSDAYQALIPVRDAALRSQFQLVGE